MAARYVAPDGDAVVVIAPRLPGALMDDGFPVGPVWRDTAVRPGDLRVAGDLLSGRAVAAADGVLRLADVLAELPVALLVR